MMKYMGLNEIREAFLAFFEARDHLRLPSFSLVPRDDPSLLLINAGMTPMKAWFRGTETPPHPRVATCQKCIRTIDIENVGFTARHGTFFEMLGNFSFGDYFKKEIIPWSWELSTVVFGFDPERLHVSVYLDDDEAYEIWRDDVGVPEERIVRLGKESNFWEHGTGPCGPCSELFYDRGREYGCDSPDCGPDCDCDRFIEYWNLVFTEFDRLEDGSYVPLRQKNIDTGAGLERIATILQGVDNLFEVDTVRSILDRVCELTGVSYGSDAKQDVSIRIITDHIRSTVMMVSDGILPSNEGRGYVLRRLLRRAVRNGRLLGIGERFLADLAGTVIAASGSAYPELEERRDYILSVLDREERRFLQTLSQGEGLLAEMIASVRDAGGTELAGADAFRLHDTYGFPFDLTREIALEAGLAVDEAGFRECMEQQRRLAREALAAQDGSAWAGAALPRSIEALPATLFSGYERLEDEAEVLGIVALGSAEEAAEPTDVETAGEGSRILLITDRTPFYARSGGQVGDAGCVLAGGDLEIEVQDTTASNSGIRLHHGLIRRGLVQRGQKVTLAVDGTRRLAIARNHTATHLLHQALRLELGDTVNQAGSEVDADGFRFDFTWDRALSADELGRVQRTVNRAILDDRPVTVRHMDLQEARAEGAAALFDEKYGDVVRVITVGAAGGPADMPLAPADVFSIELCAGTHLERSSQAALFVILSEASIAAGIRRITALTGAAAMRHVHAAEAELRRAAAELRSDTASVAERIHQLQQELRQSERERARLESKLAGAAAGSLETEAVLINGISVLIAEVTAGGIDALRDTAASLRDRLEPALVLLAAVQEERLSFVAMASPAAVTAGAHCGRLISAAAKAAGGGGGGRPEMAQAGARDAGRLADALATAREVASRQLA